MKKYFEEQLKESTPILAIVLPLLKGKSVYSEYQIGDVVVQFMLMEYYDFNSSLPAKFSIIPIVERELDLMKNDYKYVKNGMIESPKIPVFEKITKGFRDLKEVK